MSQQQQSFSFFIDEELHSHRLLPSSAHDDGEDYDDEDDDNSSHQQSNSDSQNKSTSNLCLRRVSSFFGNESVPALGLKKSLDRIQLGKTGSCYFIAVLISSLNSFLLSLENESNFRNDEEEEVAAVVMKMFFSKFFILEKCDVKRGRYFCKFHLPLFFRASAQNQQKTENNSSAVKNADENNDEIVVEIDDFLPFDVKRNKLVYSRIELGKSESEQLKNSHHRNCEIEDHTTSSRTILVLSYFWVSLVEKAYVKYKLLFLRDGEEKRSTSIYEIIRRGSFFKAARELFGNHLCVENLKSDWFTNFDTKRNLRLDIDSKKKMKIKSKSLREKKEQEQLWNHLTATETEIKTGKNVLRSDILLNFCTSFRHSTSSSERETKIRSLGLVPGHSYSVIGLYRNVCNDGECSNFVVELRDPATSITKGKKLAMLRRSQHCCVQQETMIDSPRSTTFNIDFADLFSDREPSPSGFSCTALTSTLGKYFQKGSAWLVHHRLIGDGTAVDYGNAFVKSQITLEQTTTRSVFHPRYVWKVEVENNLKEENQQTLRFGLVQELCECESDGDDHDENTEEVAEGNSTNESTTIGKKNKQKLIAMRLSILSSANDGEEGKNNSNDDEDSRRAVVAISNPKFRRKSEMWVNVNLKAGKKDCYLVVPLAMMPEDNVTQTKIALVMMCPEGNTAKIIHKIPFGNQSEHILKATHWR